MDKDLKAGEQKQDVRTDEKSFTQPQSKPTKVGPKGGDEVTWTASEYIAHNKGFGWYVLLILAAGVLAALVYLLARDIISTVAVVVIAVIFAVAGGFKPRVLTYRLDGSGLTIGSKFYPYGNFKSFILTQEGAFPSITFMPLKRFMPSISVFFAQDDQDKIVNVLSNHLPLNPNSGELVDRIMRRIRF